MYDEMLFMCPSSLKIFSISCYLAGFFDAQGNIPDDIQKALEENKIGKWLDDYLLDKGCVFIGHV